MTDTPEAVRLADDLTQLASEGAALIHLQSGAYICHKFAEAAALLCRIPELETARDVAVELAAKYAAERDQLRAGLDARWQPIETAPKGQSVLLWVTRGGDRCVIDDWGDYDRHNHPRITHWMPLPAAPTPPNADQKGQ